MRIVCNTIDLRNLSMVVKWASINTYSHKYDEKNITIESDAKRA